jgi:uncharacterized protein (UPF0264 family)
VITSPSRGDGNGINPSPILPQLLVSVRSVMEAHSALAGGAGILDVKEPIHGSLGMADPVVINEICHALRDVISVGSGLGSNRRPLSVALGELRDWIERTEVPALPGEVTFAKLGLGQLAKQADWPEEWTRVRAKFDRLRAVPLRWVAVAYADEQVAESPPLDRILAAAVETGCAGMLIDTYSKTGRTILDFLPPSTLRTAADHCHRNGLFFAVAGGVTIESLGTLREIGADIIAIRSAACPAANRQSTIESANVARFHDAMCREFHAASQGELVNRTR